MGSIRVSGLGKAYKQYRGRWSRLIEWFVPFAKPRHHLKWVIRDISFEVGAGEAVGIIGINGAGKSTLLKMITGTTMSTTGSVALQGRVAALLELGMGFHPEFTGRQNVLMSGQLLGLTLQELEALMPDIEAFAEIGEYIDQPVRTYSSGMQVRLAFSVATAKRPDILIVDEALAVGDAYFQHKSFDRIRTFNQAGTTLLFVTHDKASVQSICNRAILINAGTLEKQGDPQEVMDYYNALLAEREGSRIQQTTREDGQVATRSGTGEAVVEKIELVDADGRVCEMFDVGVPVSLRVSIRVHADLPKLVFGYMIKDKLGQAVFGTNTELCQCPLQDLKAGSRIEYRFDFPLNLGQGSYSITTSLSSNETHLVNNYEWRDLAWVFAVNNMSRNVFVGCAWIEPAIDVQIWPEAEALSR